MEQDKDMYLLHVDEIFDSMGGRQESESLIEQTSKYDLSIEEYLFFLANALYVVNSDSRIDKQCIDEFFMEFYLKHKNSYKKSEDFISKLIFGSILSLFSDSVFIDIHKVEEWEQNCENDIRKDGMPSGNGYAQEYYDKNIIIDYKYKSQLKMFSDPEIYAKLRKQTLESVKLLLKREEKENWKRTKEEKSSKGKVQLEETPKMDVNLYSYFDKNYINIVREISEKHSGLCAELIDIFEVCETEVKLFSDCLKGKTRVDNYNPLTVKEKIILTTFRLYNEGFRSLPESTIARAVAIEYGGEEETYRKILKQIVNDGFDTQKFKNIETLIEVVKKGAGESNIRIANEKYEKIKGLTSQSLRELLK